MLRANRYRADLDDSVIGRVVRLDGSGNLGIVLKHNTSSVYVRWFGEIDKTKPFGPVYRTSWAGRYEIEIIDMEEDEIAMLVLSALGES